MSDHKDEELEKKQSPTVEPAAYKPRYMTDEQAKKAAEYVMEKYAEVLKRLADS